MTITVKGVNDDPTLIGQSVDADADAVLNDSGLLNGADDLDGDTLSVVADTLTSSRGAAVTINANGTFSYDPTGVSDFVDLGEDQTTTDTFEYTVTDPHGATATASITVTVFGANDAPTAGADSGGVVQNQTVDLGVVGNDTDPDSGDILSISAVDGTSAMGATITINADGTLKYDPTGSATLQAITSPVVDTFTYTVSDDHGGTSTATVSVTVQPLVNTAPTLTAPINDFNLTDGHGQPAMIDLTTVFSDDGPSDLHGDQQ